MTNETVSERSIFRLVLFDDVVGIGGKYMNMNAFRKLLLSDLVGCDVVHIEAAAGVAMEVGTQLLEEMSREAHRSLKISKRTLTDSVGTAFEKVVFDLYDNRPDQEKAGVYNIVCAGEGGREIWLVDKDRAVATRSNRLGNLRNKSYWYEAGIRAVLQMRGFEVEDCTPDRVKFHVIDHKHEEGGVYHPGSQDEETRACASGLVENCTCGTMLFTEKGMAVKKQVERKAAAVPYL